MKNTMLKNMKFGSIALALSLSAMSMSADDIKDSNLDSKNKKTQANENESRDGENSYRVIKREPVHRGAMANAIHDSKSSGEDDRFFKFGGQLSNFMKLGFNNAKINKDIGQYPTSSFGQLLGIFETRYNFLNLTSMGSITKFNVGLGASTSGLFFDSTLRDGAADAYPTSGLNSGSGRNLKYVGVSYPSGVYKDNRYFILQNAFLDFETRIGNSLVAGHDLFFAFKGGRYESDMDYYSAYTQGFNADFHFGYGDESANPNNKIKVWWFSSFARAFAYPEWFYDYGPVLTSGSASNPSNYGVHAFGVDVNYGGFAKSSSGYDKGEKILVSPFMYFYPGMYQSYGLKGVYENQLGNGYGVKATLQGYYLNVNEKYTTAFDSSNRSNDEIVEANSGNIMAILQANMFQYNARIGLYQNFKSGASKIGTYGSPIGFDYWAGTVYDTSTGMSDVLSRNATTGFISGGGAHDLQYGKLTWSVLGRLTTSDRSDEQSLVFELKHRFKNNLALGMRVEWLRDTTKKGYNPGDNIYPNATKLTANRTDDRSYAFVMVDYLF